MKTFSRSSFLVGLLVGAIVTVIITGIIATVSVSQLSAGRGYSEGVLSDIVNQAVSDREFARSKSVYGQVQSISDTEISIEANRTGERLQFTFTYDDTTRFSTYLRDDASTEVEVEPNTITVGDGVTVTSDAGISTENTTHAVRIIEI